MAKHIQPFHIACFIIAMFVFLLVGCANANSPAATPQPQPIRDANLEQTFEQQLDKINPAAVPIYQKATQAMDSGDNATAEKLYQQVIDLAPTFSAAYRRLGYVEANLKNLDRAEELSRKALDLEPIAYNQTALAMILVRKNTPKDSMDAFNLASAAVKTLPNDDQTNLALLLSAGAVNNLPAVRQADELLLKLEPDNPVVQYFAGILAATDGKWEDAETKLLYSQKLGMPQDAVQHALDGGISRNVLLARLLRWGTVALALWLLGLGILFLLGSFLSRATIQALNNAQPAMDAQVKPEERRIRSIYRVLIAVLSLYFYISIPFVILLLLLVVGGVFYVFLVIGSFPIQLSIILVLMVVASLFAIARALFSRTKDVVPGRLLRRMDAPELWTLVENVARKLGTRPVDAIYVIPGVEIAVNEKGSLLQKLRGAGKRNLLLGMGVLPGLTQGQLAAILAHEYGHFSNRDTAGGDMAYQVFTSLRQMAQRLIQGRAAQIYNPVWLFVVIYQRIFLRVTLGASRLQEVLADRYAAIAYGGQNFIEGLQSVIRQTIAFPLQANYEVHRLFELKQPVNNLYNLPAQESLQGELDKQLDAMTKRPTSQYDSHPSPQDRIAWVERLHIPYSPIQDNPQPALRLFPNPEELQRDMTARIMKNVRK